jgi:hypothetical protein
MELGDVGAKSDFCPFAVRRKSGSHSAVGVAIGSFIKASRDRGGGGARVTSCAAASRGVTPQPLL